MQVLLQCRFRAGVRQVLLAIVALRQRVSLEAVIHAAAESRLLSIIFYRAYEHAQRAITGASV
jgi:uncharacterized MnhB-related membrane protein